MMNATLRGKPDAGNPHVRFDEGEFASENPRRGSLLYTDRIVLFYGHNKSPKVTDSCFSQFYPCEFAIDGQKYHFAEQFMMAEKARAFGDKKTLTKILAAEDPAKIKALGRRVKPFDEKMWATIAENVVMVGNFAKFSQNQKLKDYLLESGDAILAEASPKDRIWGIGLAKSDKRATNPKNWKGKNLLGFALMRVRDALSRNDDEARFRADHPIPQFGAEVLKMLNDAIEKEKAARRRIADAQREANRRTPEYRERKAVATAYAAAKSSVNKPAKGNTMPAFVVGGLPGATRYSTVIGLMSSPSDKKWNLFLREGPYWNYLVNFIQKKNIFHGRKDRVDEAVLNTCEKIAKFMMAKRYKYQEEGKGFFRSFLKTVAFRTALDLLKDIRRQEQMCVSESEAETTSEFDKMQEDMQKSADNRRRMAAKSKVPQGIGDEIAPSSERDLDVYDASAGLKRDIAPEEKNSPRKMHAISRLDDNPFSDDEVPANYNPADFFAYLTKMSKEDLGWMQRLQIHVLYIALGYILTNEKISPDRREMLRLRYGCDMQVKDVYATPRFANKNRNALDQMMKNANDDLRAEVATWWKLVAPDKNDFADETILKFWRELSRKDERAKIAIELQNKANETAGRIK